MRLDELLAPRKVGTYRIGDEDTVASRLARVLPAFDLSPETVGAIVEAYYSDLEQSTGLVIKLQRITKTENDKILALAKKTERKFDQATKVWSGGDVDINDYLFLRLAAAIVEPEVPGDDLRVKATYLTDNLTMAEAQELMAASAALDSFNLSRAQELVKN